VNDLKKESGTDNFTTTIVGGEEVRIYLPPPLPPEPKLNLEKLYVLMEDANQALGRLDGITSILPDPQLFIYMYVRKEALLSSQIEGTQSSLSDLLLFENEETPGVPLDDVKEVSNYVAAMEHGLERLHKDFPLSLRLIREIHEVLLSGGRGSEKSPGEFRRSQNWIGGTRPGNAFFVPPPPEKVQPFMSELEKFIYEERSKLPVLIKAALIHVQFESIHPFLDGNGRLGRLLITFILCAEGVLREPTLYLSLYFKTHKKVYYDLLQRVREDDDWGAWLDFFLTGVKVTSEQAAETAHQILDLFEKDRQKIESLGRPTASSLRVFQYIQSKPILSVPKAAIELGISAPTIRKSADHLEGLGIIREITGKKRNKLYIYDNYLSIVKKGTEVGKN